MQFIKSLLVLIIIGFFTSASFAQLDPIQYQGPSDGSVTSGATQNTGNFTLMERKSGPKRIIPLMELEDPVDEELFIEWDESLLPEYVYVEDTGVTENPNGGQTVLIKSFPGIPMTNSIPPDPHLAVGPNHIIAAVNGQFSIFDKEGNELKSINPGQWFNPISPYERGDPQVLYDHYEGRWILLYMGQNDPAQIASNLIAYSDDDNPLGTWYIYSLDTKKHGTVNSNTWGDYPQISYDDEAIYVMTRCFTFAANPNYQYNKIRIIDKAELYASNGGPLTWTDIWDIRAPNSASYAPDVIHPVISYTPGQGGWFFWANYSGSSYYYAYKIANPLTSPVLTGRVIPAVQYYGPTPLANQLGGGTLIETGGSKIRTNPVIRDGFLYGAHSVRNSTATAYSSVRYFKFNLSTTVIDEIGELGASGYFYIYPTISVDENSNIGVTFSRSANTEYIGAYYSSKLAIDPPGLEPSQPLAEGQGNYDVTFGGSRNRWGDYLGICIDPSNYEDIWMLSEYAAATNTWGTWIGSIRMTPYAGIYPFVSPEITDFGDVEVNTSSDVMTVILANYGTDDLVISDIANSVGPFTLESSHSYPLTLLSFDSVEVKVKFSPTSAGMYDEILPVTSNEPSFTGINLTGHGYDMLEASSNILYASSGAATNGIVITVDMQTGTGTLLGSSQFTELRSLSVNPSTNIMFGLAIEAGAIKIVRVNAGGGDAYELFPTNLPNLSGIAFNSTGILYASQQTGEIYTIDLVTGNSTLVTTANILINSIAFHPTTDVLWAAKWKAIGTGKDEIYTIDLSNGNATLIGETGFSVITNDLAFDGADILYGIFGAANEVGSLITINTSDGTGTLVGETGFNHITGLGYSLNGPPSGVNDDDVVTPKEFALQQNYPNPFNPTTTIQFSLPVNSDVKLVVYNMLGQEVATLLNEQRSIGSHSIVWNSSNTNGVKLSSGIYFYELKANGINGGSFQEIRKMVLLK